MFCLPIDYTKLSQFYKWCFWAPVIDPAWMWQFLNTRWFLIFIICCSDIFASEFFSLVPSTELEHTLTGVPKVRISSSKIFKLTVLFQSLIQWPRTVLFFFQNLEGTMGHCDAWYPTIHSSEVWEYGTKSYLSVVFTLYGHWYVYCKLSYHGTCWILLLYLPFCWLSSFFLEGYIFIGYIIWSGLPFNRDISIVFSMA